MRSPRNKTYFSLRFLATAAMLAAVYAVLTYAGLGFSYGSIQFRLSEALIPLAAFLPAAIPGLTLGCMIANLASPWGILDVIVGSLATLLATLFAYGVRSVRWKQIPFLAPLGAVIINALFVGCMIWALSDSSTLFWLTALQIGAGELLVGYSLGLPLLVMLERTANRH